VLEIGGEVSEIDDFFVTCPTGCHSGKLYHDHTYFPVGDEAIAFARRYIILHILG
jgi:hypothetical protein